MIDLALELVGLQPRDGTAGEGANYSVGNLQRKFMDWDRVVKSSHPTNCWYQRACNFNLYVKDGIVLREEQVGNYPPPNDASVPDPNPRGCQKGVCYAQRMYDPTRIKYPLKRVGERGQGRWQRISWDQALTEIADGVIDVLATDGPEVIMNAGGTRVHSQGSEGMGPNAFFEALGAPHPSVNAEIGDDHQGVGITLGKIMFADSADNWFHADTILVWGANPAYTNIPNFHYIAEARYHGTRVIAVSPDYNASAIHADLWVPVNIGTDAALALAAAQIIIRDKLHKEGFIREQSDLPLLVRDDNGKFLREKDLKSGGREDVFYFYDETSARVMEAPRKSLALNGVVPALEGVYEVRALSGTLRVRPVFALLRRWLDDQFTPEKAAAITGVPPSLIEKFARDVATAGGVVNISAGNWGKFYHGDLIERAILLLFTLCGHIGRKGASFSAFPALHPDTALGALERRGHQLLQSAASNDPRYSTWKEDGYTTEMILYEYAKQIVASGGICGTSMTHLFHGGLLELSERHDSWDRYLKRPVRDYVKEALAKGWQVITPSAEKSPRVLFQVGGNVFRRGRATKQLINTLLPKLKLIVTVDWRMSATGLHSDYVLPACGWYERTSTNLWACTQSPFMHISNKATEPLYDSLSEWTVFVLMARKIAERARARGADAYKDKSGKERRFDRLEDSVTCGGLYAEDDEEGVARDAFLNTGNVEQIGWEEVRERGFAAYTAVGTAMRSIGNACDLEVGEPLVPLTWHTAKKEPYPTLTRRMQFYIDHDWYLELEEHLPTHKDCPRAGGNYPLQVTGGHARWSIHSDWVDDALILALQRGEPVLFMNTDDAAARNISDDDVVEAFNDVASFRAQAVVSAGVRPGQAIIYHAWENYQFEGWGHFKSVMASPLNPIELVGDYGHIRPDALICMPGQNDRDTRVEVRKLQARV
jgi:DMSO reductase family type II enzyme molybdopterin subunit